MEVTSVRFIVSLCTEGATDVPADGGFLSDKGAEARYTIKGTRSIIIMV